MKNKYWKNYYIVGRKEIIRNMDYIVQLDFEL